MKTPPDLAQLVSALAGETIAAQALLDAENDAQWQRWAEAVQRRPELPAELLRAIAPRRSQIAATEITARIAFSDTREIALSIGVGLLNAAQDILYARHSRGRTSDSSLSLSIQSQPLSTQ